MNDFARGYLAAERADRHIVTLRESDVLINDGYINDALIFAQIRYWHDLGKSGKIRLSIEKDGHLWLAKKYSDWDEECFVNEHTAKKSINRIKKRGLIFTKLWQFAGVPTLHIRINWDEFEKRITSIRYKRSDPLDRFGLMDQTSEAQSYTETTTETTNNKDIPPTCSIDKCKTAVPTEGDTCLYCQMRAAWAQCFPKKPQPRLNVKSYIKKLDTRAKNDHFVEHWQAAMKRASQSKFCQSNGWFDFEWFIKNDEHYERCLNGKYDDQTANSHQAGGEYFDKHELLAELIKLVSTYGRINFKKAEAAASFNLRQLVIYMDRNGGWPAICGLSGENLRIKFYQSFAQIADLSLLRKQETKNV